jgi:hypothetical protein
MMTITFGTDTFDNIPESYDETNLGRFIEVMKLQKKESEYTSKTLFTADLLASIIGCEVEYILELDTDEVSQLAEAFSWLSKNPEEKSIETLEIDGVVYAIKKNANLKLGEQVSIETFLQSDLTNVENFHLVMAILLRPAIQKEDVYTKELKWQLKPLEDDFNLIVDRANMFKQKLMINDIYGTLTAFSIGVKNSSMKTSEASSHLKIVRRNQSL